METAAISGAGTTATGRKAGLKGLEVEDFINMMVTQLQNQDPLEPAKNDQLLAQMSQIGQLQSAQDMQSAMRTLVEDNNTMLQQLAAQNSVSSAGSMIGKVVEGVVTEGDKEVKLNGTVTAVTVDKDGLVKLELDSGKFLPLSGVRSISGSGNGPGTAIAP